MKVLVYGAGVIGGQLTHALCKNGNDVTVVARGAWAETLRQNGLRIRHYVQREETVDRPRVLEAPDDAQYDAVFAVMQYRQMEKILPALAAIDSPLVVLVGNDLSAPEMEARILAETKTPKTVLFGFQSTAGRREKGRVVAAHLGDGKLTVGGLHADAPLETKAAVTKLFSSGKYTLAWCDNMDAWLKYHAAFIVPTVYLTYGVDCDLRRTTRAQRKQLLDAACEAYRLLTALGVPVRPEGDEKSLEPGPTRWMSSAVIWAMAKTKLGELCASDHCRNAVDEMEDLSEGFHAIRAQKPDFPMPAFDALRAAMPPWEELRRRYVKEPGR